MNEQQPYTTEQPSYKIGEFLSKGWKFTKQHLGFFISYVIIMFFISFLFGGIAEALSEQGRNFLSFLIHVAGWIVGTFIQMGLYKSALLVTSGIKPGFDQLYTNDKYFFSYFISSLLYGLMILIGILLFIIPGLYVLARYALFPFFVLDKNMGPVEALKAASKASEGKRWFLFLFLIVLGLINIGGALLLGIGLLFTIPISLLAFTAVYRRITNTEHEIAVPENQQ
jgi:uncharacterized membrane protein